MCLLEKSNVLAFQKLPVLFNKINPRISRHDTIIFCADFFKHFYAEFSCFNVFRIALNQYVEYLKAKLCLVVLHVFTGFVYNAPSVANEVEEGGVDFAYWTRDQVGGVAIKIAVIPAVGIIYEEFGARIAKSKLWVIGQVVGQFDFVNHFGDVYIAVDAVYDLIVQVANGFDVDL